MNGLIGGLFGVGFLLGRRPKFSEWPGCDAKINQGRLAGKVRKDACNYLNLVWVLCCLIRGALRRGDVMRKCLGRVIPHSGGESDGRGGS